MAVSNLYLGSWLVVLAICLSLLLRRCMRRDEAPERFCNVVSVESELTGSGRKEPQRVSC